MAKRIILEADDKGQITLECGGEEVTIEVRCKKTSRTTENASDEKQVEEDLLRGWGLPSSSYLRTTNNILIAGSFASVNHLKEGFDKLSRLHGKPTQDSEGQTLFFLKLAAAEKIRFKDLIHLRDLGDENTQISIAMASDLG
jgi:hypothetical protein